MIWVIALFAMLLLIGLYLLFAKSDRPTRTPTIEDQIAVHTNPQQTPTNTYASIFAQGSIIQVIGSPAIWIYYNEKKYLLTPVTWRSLGNPASVFVSIPLFNEIPIGDMSEVDMLALISSGKLKPLVLATTSNILLPANATAESFKNPAFTALYVMDGTMIKCGPVAAVYMYTQGTLTLLDEQTWSRNGGGANTYTLPCDIMNYILQSH
jgi:hypothetical protein